MRAALVDASNTVTNVILYDDGYDPGPGLTLVPLTDDEPCGPGWAYSGGVFTQPAPVEPTPVPPTDMENMQAQLDELADYVYGAP